MTKNKETKFEEICPKCNSMDIVFEGHWSGIMVTDIHADHYWLAKCKSCGFTFKPSSDEDKPDPLYGRRNHG